MTRGNRPLSGIMFDIDHFKRINDTFGHEMGDKVVAAVGGQAKLADGVTGRLGGEEFCLLMEGGVTDAMEAAGELQRSIRALRFHHGEQAFGVTCSFGVAEWEEQDTIDTMLRRADMAMYEAKKTGRDRIIASDTFVLTKSHDDWAGAARVANRRV
jgi:diguanylate cyclase (GGDEF)-like protein